MTSMSVAALWLLLIAAVGAFTSLQVAVTASPLGRGHRVTSVYEFPDGRGFVADLEVIEQSTLYGADINELRMTVRYFTSTLARNLAI